MSADDHSFVEDLPEFVKPNWTPAPRREPDALELVSETNDDGELTIYPAEGETTTEWITSDKYVEVGDDE